MNIAETFLRKLSDEQLLDAWEFTTTSNDEDVYTVRGWLMNEFERRHPTEWNEWLESEALDESLRIYILGGNRK